MEVAIVITVKNEARLLRQNIFYHLGIGVKKMFIYFDNTTDGGRELVESIDGVFCSESITSNKYDDLPYLKKFTNQKFTQHSARQCINSYDAELQCIKEGIDWLISIDADEFFLLPRSEGYKTIQEFFKSASAQNYDIVRFGVFEVIPRKMKYDLVAIEETLFKTKKNFKSKFDQIYFEITDPYTKDKITTHFWLSHNMGKSAIRTGRDIIPHNVHKYKARHEGQHVKTLFSGHILHYFQYDLYDFIKKSQNFKLRPKHYLSGKRIGRLKNLYIRLVNDENKTIEDITIFYKKNLLFNQRKVSRLYKTRVFNILPRREDAVIEITDVRDVLLPYKSLIYTRDRKT